MAAALVLSLAWLPLAVSVDAAPPAEAAAKAATRQALAVVKSLKPQQGKITMPEAKATLDLGSKYDFYGPEDARKILVELWGNPPEAVEGVLGLVMAAKASPMSDAWGAVVTFEDSGYVSDSDANEVDYAELLGQMQEGEVENNAQRKSAGYAEIHLEGWAEQPQYNNATHSVIWARNLKFSDSPVNTLNYDVRSLGRSGVLSLNLVSSMPKLAEIKQVADDFAAKASFDEGARYADYDASTDRTAEYGIGGLVAAGVGVAMAKKLGILAILLKFIKPILLGLFVLFATFRGKIMGLFRRNRGSVEGEDYPDQA